MGAKTQPKQRHMPPQSIDDYRKLYQREQRKRIVLEAKCQRINNVMTAGLSPRLKLLAIALTLTPTQDKQPLYLKGGTTHGT